MLQKSIAHPFCSFLFSFGLLGAGIIATANVRADIISVVNPSFEDVGGSVLFNEFSFGPPVGWQIHNPAGIVVNNGVGPDFWIGTVLPSPPEFFLDGAPEGQRVAIPFNLAGTGGLGEYGLRQTLTSTLQANFHYELRVEVGNIASGVSQSGQYFELEGFPGYRVDLLAGGVVLASDDNSLSGWIPEGEWRTSQINFLAPANHALLGQPLEIRLVNLNQVDPLHSGSHLEVDFDWVRLNAVAVPEPSGVMVVLLVGLTILFWYRRRVPRALLKETIGATRVIS